MSLAKSIATTIALLSLGLTACGGLSRADTATVSTSTVAEAPTPTTERQGATTTTASPVITASRVVDGDTFEGSDGITYRLAAIDAPEYGTALGPAATQRLTELLRGPITVELGEVASIDRYGRTLAYIFVGETFVNETLIREGLAAESFYGDNEKYRQRYLDAQSAAQAEGLGIWEVAAPVPPTTPPPAPPSPPPATAPPPVAVPSPPPADSGCTPGYTPCIPPGPDVDCAGGSGNGPRYTGPVTVTGPDIYDLDRDHDGAGCESS